MIHTLHNCINALGMTIFMQFDANFISAGVTPMTMTALLKNHLLGNNIF